MIQATFNLSKIPFTKQIDTKELFIHDKFNLMISRMGQLFENRGIGMFTGDVGCGKSTAVRTAVSKLSSQTHKPIYIYRGLDDMGAFYKQIAYELGIMPKFKRSDMARQVITTIAENYQQQKITTVIIVDEAHLLKPDILDEIRLIHNSGYDSEDFLATALVGQPSLKKMINYNKFLPLKQRIAVAYHLKALSKSEAYKYFEHQIALSKANTKIFLDNAIETIVTYSKGVPRVINNIALKSMQNAAENKNQLVDQECVMEILEELGIN